MERIEVPSGADPWQHLVTAGLLVEGDGSDLLDLVPVPLPDGAPRPADVLHALRSDEAAGP